MSARRRRRMLLVALAVSLVVGVAFTTLRERDPDPSAAIAPTAAQPNAVAPVQRPRVAEDAKPQVATGSPGGGFEARAIVPIVRVHAPPTVGVGTSFDAEVHVDNRMPVSKLLLTVTYDRKRLALSSVEEGGLVSGGPLRGHLSTDEPSDGNVQLDLTFPGGAAVAGTGSIAILRFEATAAGTFAIATRNATVVDANGVAHTRMGVIHEAAITIR